MEKAKINKIEVSSDYLIGKTLANDCIDQESGEILVNANTEITAEVLNNLRKAGITSIKTLYTNDLDHGPYISDTLRLDPTKSQIRSFS